MQVDFSLNFNSGETIAVAVSGGGDSMALLHAMKSQEKVLNIKVLALNVEHGIRGESSISDSAFVKNYCQKNDIKLLSYSVDSLKKAKEEGLSIEQSARALRYECFFDAIKSGKCDKVATAHHLSDNTESVILNIFRGTGLKGIAGIEDNYLDKIVRPFLSTPKTEIEKYLQEKGVPFVTDETNLSDAYTRNYLRINIIPKIKEIFPDADKSIKRLTEIVKTDNEYIEQVARAHIKLLEDRVELPLPVHKAVFSRASIMALKHLGIEKDWEKAHIDSAYSLSQMETGSKVNLPKGVIAIKEYDKIVFYKESENNTVPIPLTYGKTAYLNSEILIEEVKDGSVDLKSGLFADAEKIPSSAVIRTKEDGDTFTKFGGGTKSLGDYLTDKKIPLRVRESLPIIASGKEVLVIFGVAVSDKVKVDSATTKLIKFTIR